MRVRKATEYLERAEAVTTENLVFRLLGLHWAGARKHIESAASALLSRQREDGGFGQEKDSPSGAYATGEALTDRLAESESGRSPRPSDAYATGEALTSLLEVGALSRGAPALARAVRYLLRTRRDDGSWFVLSRSIPVQPYLESGFPYGRSQFSSVAATAWATAALAASLEPRPSK
jgi:squalene cyclase